MDRAGSMTLTDNVKRPIQTRQADARTGQTGPKTWMGWVWLARQFGQVVPDDLYRLSRLETLWVERASRPVHAELCLALSTQLLENSI